MVLDKEDGKEGCMKATVDLQVVKKLFGKNAFLGSLWGKLGIRVTDEMLGRFERALSRFDLDELRKKASSHTLSLGWKLSAEAWRHIQMPPDGRRVIPLSSPWFTGHEWSITPSPYACRLMSIVPGFLGESIEDQWKRIPKGEDFPTVAEVIEQTILYTLAHGGPPRSDYLVRTKDRSRKGESTGQAHNGEYEYASVMVTPRGIYVVPESGAGDPRIGVVWVKRVLIPM